MMNCSCMANDMYMNQWLAVIFIPHDSERPLRYKSKIIYTPVDANECVICITIKEVGLEVGTLYSVYRMVVYLYSVV